MYIEIGYNMNDVITDNEINKQLKLTLENLNKLGIINNDIELESYSTIVMDPAYVHINADTNKLLDEVKKQLKEKNIYTIGRYGAWIYNSMEDSMLKAKELAEKLNKIDIG